MPIANCFLSDPNLLMDNLDEIAADWADTISLDKNEITINVLTGHEQAGKKYALLIHLYLPNLWQKKDIAKIQMGLMKVFCKHLVLPEKEIFILTTLIESGHVVENGQITEW